MYPQVFEINLDHATRRFIAGQIITGRIVLVLQKEKAVKGLNFIHYTYFYHAIANNGAVLLVHASENPFKLSMNLPFSKVSIFAFMEKVTFHGKLE